MAFCSRGQGMSQKVTGQRHRDVSISLIALGVAVTTIGLEVVIPLGYAVWLLYFLAIGVTVYQRRPWVPVAIAVLACALLVFGFHLAPPSHNSAFSVVNRTVGGMCFLTTALIVMQAIKARLQAERALWLQEVENEVSGVLQGEQSPQALAEGALRVLCDHVGAHTGVLYRLAGQELVLVGGVALAREVPNRIEAGSGQLWEAIAKRSTRVVRGIEASHVGVESALGRSAAMKLLVAPLTVDGAASGALELGLIESAVDESTAVELLQRCADTIGIALRTAMLRTELLELLEETQRQGEELQAQQEELRVANEELEEQSRTLQHSQVNLEQQQAELEQTNVQLEERTHELEGQRQQLLSAQDNLMRSREELLAASRYKSEFLANMSHELRTPLNSSLILAKLLADNKESTLTADQVKYAQAIHSSNNDLLALINDILDLSKIEAGHVELQDDTLSTDSVLERLRETFDPLARQKGLDLSLVIEAGAPAQFVADGQRLQQILKNLLANAIKFTERGSVSLHVKEAQARIGFVVCDTGIGIAREQTEVIFEAFRQADGSTSRRFGGTGLGLAISRDLAARMGGSLSVESEPGRGSCFTLIIPTDGAPAADQVPAAAPLPEGGYPAAAQTTRLVALPTTTSAPAAPAAVLVTASPITRRFQDRLILAIEDDVEFGQALIGLAQDLSFDCVVASTAEEGLRLAAELRPNGILLDIGLPDVSGLSVLERLKRDPATRHVPVHVVSALERTQVAMELGAVGYLIKPATRERLVSAIEQLEQTHARDVRRLLIVEDDQELRQSLQLLLAREQLEIVAVGTIAEAIEKLDGTTFDCMITDLALPDGSGYDLLERMSASATGAFPPVIVYTGRALTRHEEQRLRRYSKSIIIKGARSPERLLDEVTLFLHSVEANLPGDQQRMLREVRRRDAVLDGRNVLLVEDDVRNIFALSSVLEPLGVRLQIARNGREALDTLVNHDFDLVLMDIMMPEMDGLTAMREIRRNPQWQDLPIIALTAKAMPDDREHCLEAGANDYIAKPVDVEKLVSLCRVWCARQ